MKEFALSYYPRINIPQIKKSPEITTQAVAIILPHLDLLRLIVRNEYCIYNLRSKQNYR